MLDRLLRTAAPYAAYSYMTLVGRSSRIEWLGMQHVRGLESRGSNFIYAFWHNRQVLFTYTHRNAGISVLVSRSQDGEIIARTMSLSGIGAVRGSTSRGAASATRELLELASKGARVGFTPDGPKGPAGVVKPGVLFLAAKTGLPIVPISNATSRKLVLRRSWDEFQVPLPCARSCVIHDAPIQVSPTDDMPAKASALKESLDRITEEAERAVGNIGARAAGASA